MMKKYKHTGDIFQVFIYMYVYGCTCIPLMFMPVCTRRPKEGVRSLRTGVAGVSWVPNSGTHSGSHDCPANALNHWLVFSALAAKTLTYPAPLSESSGNNLDTVLPTTDTHQVRFSPPIPRPRALLFVHTCVGPDWICGAHWKCLDG